MLQPQLLRISKFTAETIRDIQDKIWAFAHEEREEEEVNETDVNLKGHDGSGHVTSKCFKSFKQSAVLQDSNNGIINATLWN